MNATLEAADGEPRVDVDELAGGPQGDEVRGEAVQKPCDRVFGTKHQASIKASIRAFQ